MLIGTYVCYVNANWRLSEQNSEPMEQDDGQPKSPQSEGQQLGESSISFLSTSSGQPMDTQLNPVRTHASVLLPADEFDVYKDDFDKPKSIITAAHLGKAVRARAEMELANWGDATPLCWCSTPFRFRKTHSLLKTSNQTTQSISKAD